MYIVRSEIKLDNGYITMKDTFLLSRMGANLLAFILRKAGHPVKVFYVKG